MTRAYKHGDSSEGKFVAFFTVKHEAETLQIEKSAVVTSESSATESAYDSAATTYTNIPIHAIEDLIALLIKMPHTVQEVYLTKVQSAVLSNNMCSMAHPWQDNCERGHQTQHLRKKVLRVSAKRVSSWGTCLHEGHKDAEEWINESEISISKALSTLPPRQQLAIKASLKQVHAKGPKGVRYTHAWIILPAFESGQLSKIEHSQKHKTASTAHLQSAQPNYFRRALWLQVAVWLSHMSVPCERTLHNKHFHTGNPGFPLIAERHLKNQQVRQHQNASQMTMESLRVTDVSPAHNILPAQQGCTIYAHCKAQLTCLVGLCLFFINKLKELVSQKFCHLGRWLCAEYFGTALWTLICPSFAFSTQHAKKVPFLFLLL